MMYLLEKELRDLKQLNQQLQEEISYRKLVESQLRSFEARMRAVLEATNDIMMVVDTCGDEIVNIEILPTKKYHLYNGTNENIISQTVELFFCEETSEISLKKVSQTLKTGLACSFNYSLSCGGRLFRYCATISPISDHSVLWVARDISECISREEDLTQSKEKYQVLVNSAPVGIFQTDTRGNCIFVNPRWLEIAGMSLEEALGKGWIRALHPEDREQVIRKWYNSMQVGNEFTMECRFLTPKAKVTWLKVSAVPIHDKSGKIDGYLSTITEINGRKLVEKALEISGAQSKQKVQQLEQILEKLREIANLDGLTQVANRYCFNNYLNEQWYIKNGKNPISLILLDIDYFKGYNDTYGHPSGDACLVQVAQALKSATKDDNCLIARYGGEEFAVILPNTNGTQAQRVAQLIRQHIRELSIPHKTSSVSVNVTVSIGIAQALPYLNSSPQILINKADEALYKAKKAGRDCYYTVFE